MSLLEWVPAWRVPLAGRKMDPEPRVWAVAPISKADELVALIIRVCYRHHAMSVT